MLRLYKEYKRTYPDYLILMQVGDFYEAFFEDAIALSRLLNLTLTSRDKESVNPIPMCGVPVHAVDSYLERLISAGSSAALVKQIGDATAKKGMVERELERIVTPGIRIYSSNSVSRDESIVAAIGLPADFDIESDSVSIIFGDVSKGVLYSRDGVSAARLAQELLSIDPRELILPTEVNGKPLDRRSALVKNLERILGAPGRSKGCSLRFRLPGDLSSQRGVKRDVQAIKGYVGLSVEAKRAVDLLVNYTDEVTSGAKLTFAAIVPKSIENSVRIDSATRRHLELVQNQRDGSIEGTLLQYLDRCVTSGGFRLLKEWLLSPLSNPSEILQRLDATKFLLVRSDLRAKLRQLLSILPDIDRVASRLEIQAILPREFVALKHGLESLRGLKPLFESEAGTPQFLRSQLESIQIPEDLVELIGEALRDDPAAGLSEGGIIRPGFDRELDRISEIRLNGKSVLLQIEARERERTGIQSLKIKYTGVFGYFIEISRANLSKVPEGYIRKQTTVNGERFITEELKKLEEELLSAESKVIQLERELYEELRRKALSFSQRLRELGAIASVLDVVSSFAELSEREALVSPDIEDSRDLMIQDGVHPVLARNLSSGFIPNSLSLESFGKYCAIITGPNMGGKSTYLRQTALIVLMAQIGCFVPAKEAKIGVVDKIFTRIGASDNMAEGESTFMVEMREAAHIVENATDRSLVIIDEIGRGTATADGLSIAQAILEWIIVEVRCRTLFATHFHELTTLDKAFPAVLNLSVGSVDSGGEIIFTHQIAEGPANKSYGVEVAKLAGLPSAVLVRARTLLSVFDRLQGEGKRGLNSQRDPQLSFFPQAQSLTNAKVGLEKFREPDDYPALKRLEERLKSLELDNLTPLAALNLLNEIKREVC